MTLLARTHTRHLAAITQAEAAADAVDQAIARVWADLLRVLRTVRGPWQARHAAAGALKPLGQQVVAATHTHLQAIADKTRERTANDIVRTVPRASLAWAAANLVSRTHQRRGKVHLHESTGPARLLREDIAPQLPGAISLFFDHGTELSMTDLLRFLRHPSDMTRADQFAMFRAILFPAPSQTAVDRVVYGAIAGGMSWVQRLEAATKLAQPAHVADVVSRGYVEGKTQREIAKDLLSIVQGVQSSARRIARTEGIRIADRVQMSCHQQLGDLVLGYQLHATHDKNVRPWHLARDGVIYYANPAEGQKGYRQMPNPPDEPEDPAERPPGTPQTAYNCRCFRSAVLRPPAEVGSPGRSKPLAAGAAAVAEV